MKTLKPIKCFKNTHAWNAPRPTHWTHPFVCFDISLSLCCASLCLSFASWPAKSIQCTMSILRARIAIQHTSSVESCVCVCAYVCWQYWANEKKKKSEIKSRVREKLIQSKIENRCKEIVGKGKFVCHHWQWTSAALKFRAFSDGMWKIQRNWEISD